MIEYIIHKRFKDTAICGQVNLPATTVCTLTGNLITYEGKPLCLSTSHSGHKHFARNDDGQGLFRGKLTTAIQNKLSKKDSEYQKRWDKIWQNSRCQKYKRVEHKDFWLWNHDFFNASIDDLVYIANLIGIKETSL